MDNIIVRFILIALALVGVYKIFPQIQEPVDYYLYHPKFQQGIVSPAVNVANNVLPDKLQLPTPAIMGASTDSSSTTNSPLKELTDEIGKKAADLASDQLNALKQSASNQFCTVLIERIKQECPGIGASQP